MRSVTSEFGIKNEKNDRPDPSICAPKFVHVRPPDAERGGLRKRYMCAKSAAAEALAELRSTFDREFARQWALKARTVTNTGEIHSKLCQDANAASPGRLHTCQT